MKQKTCKNRECRKKFEPSKPMQTVCDPLCAIAYTRQQKERKQAERAKQERRDLRQRREALKTKSDWLREAQVEFNRFIRLRDYSLPCISCGTMANVKYDAGHYKSVGAYPELRLCELNVHKQCSKNCNTSKSGNIIEYRKGLIERIGADSVEWVEGPHEPLNLTIDDIKAIKAKYRAMANELKSEIDNAF